MTTPLSPEEVNNLSPTALNELVARKLGWTINKTSDHLPWYWPPNSHPQQAGVRELPDYSRRIEAAWEIVEHLKRVGYSFNVGLYANRYWQCSISSYGNVEPDAEVAMCDTAPRAICLSFLKL